MAPPSRMGGEGRRKCLISEKKILKQKVLKKVKKNAYETLSKHDYTDSLRIKKKYGMTRHIDLMYLCHDNTSLLALTKCSKRPTQTGQNGLLIGSIKVWKHISVIIKKKKITVFES